MYFTLYIYNIQLGQKPNWRLTVILFLYLRMLKLTEIDCDIFMSVKVVIDYDIFYIYLFYLYIMYFTSARSMD